MKIGVIRFPGTNCDRDVAQACELAGLTPEYVWWSEEKVTDYDGMPHGSPSFDAMDKKIIRMDKLKQVIDIVETEKESIPEEYRQAVWNNILYRTAYPSEADRTTYGRWKARMIYNVAKRQGLIEE